MIQVLDDKTRLGFRLGCITMRRKAAGILIVVFRLLIFVFVAGALVICAELPCRL